VVFNLRHVSRTAACHTALALYRWYNGNDGRNASGLYTCVGTQPNAYPVLKRHRFDGWTLSSPGARNLDNFEMSNGSSSFYVTGTDFPLNCS
jgi:hypothetical protein